MRILVATENRLLQDRNGTIYSTTNCDYAFWSRYLDVFDEVIVFARVAQVPETKLDKPPANGPNVSFCPLPIYIGPWQFLKRYRKIKKLANEAVTNTDAFILRVPGTLSTLLWRYLIKKKMPYGIEVVADPWDGMHPGNIKSITRPILRRVWRRNLLQQCEQASTAAYVTEFALQKRYPPKGWSTHYSSIELSQDMIIDESGLTNRIESIKKKLSNKSPFRICNMAGMTALYKGQNVLINAVSICRKKGLDVNLLLMGEGRCKEYYEQEVKCLGLVEHVTFLGQLLRGKQVNDQLDLADLFVLPSFTEGLPRAVIDAMARALPCIASNVGGISELLAEEDLVPPRDAAALAAKIESVYRDPLRLEKMVKRNLRVAKKYHTDELRRRRVEHYKRLRQITEEHLSAKNT